MNGYLIPLRTLLLPKENSRILFNSMSPNRPTKCGTKILITNSLLINIIDTALLLTN